MGDRFPGWSGYRLSRTEELILQATLLEGTAMLTAWERWQSLVDIEVLEPSSYALLPQLYQNLLIHGVKSSHMARLKGIYRRNWYANQLQIKHLKILLSHLRSAGIEAILLGEAALCHHENYRALSDFQLLVHAEDLESAVEQLSCLNWRTSDNIAQQFIHLQDDRACSLYLQTHLFWAIPQHCTDQMIWKNAFFGKGNLEGWQLSPTDLLLDLCTRTFWKRKSPQITGIADALMLIQFSGNDLDWSRLMTQAQRYQMIVPLRNMLILLEQVLQFSPPSWVLPALSKMPINRSEWLKYQVLAGDRISSLRSIFAHSINHLETKWIATRAKSFPGKRILQSLLKPTSSVLE